MTEQQRVHPVVDVEAPKPTAPLMPTDAVASDKWDPAARGVGGGGGRLPPPIQRTIPVRFMPPPKRHGRRGCCYRCFCWSLCAVVTVVVLLAVTAGVLYLIFDPKAPNYSVDRLTVTELQVGKEDRNVSASFEVTVRAKNPNKAIGIYYVDGSHLRISYDDIQLCEGKLPVFYQGHRNTTVFVVMLSGSIKVDEAALTALVEAQNTNEVPLVFRGKVPVRIKFGALKLWKVKFLVTCDLVASNLNVGSSVRLKSSDCGFKFRF